MRETQYKDDIGRYRKVIIPDNAPESHAQYGITIGPPDLDKLGLSENLTTRLHNELFNRGILTYRDVRSRRGELFSALQAVLGVEVNLIVEIYQENK